ncbi:DNA-directed RNA polymerase III subunit-like protein [Hapsidospora chrysogenum ATCC 11550]|uniref:DNA-directed RNA polymerase III subunit RPC6 n=1 Tax=Hapsidospora chrysogenum (strain ATCC 11550 / CBS 779.69 / DSM 880 / IAM 14645 / JCM 23072 / IMI 49137) TaxID=857340 RepID=A0A086T1V2_HAPC1|nr:DNA-directed RNA polymerase III subunit-like protein [Hapsidospora chrysogenum ATCC 11550]
MAPATAARASAARDEGSDPEAAKLAVWKQALYDRVRETRRENDLFTQEDLTDLGVIPNKDKGLLLQVIQALSNDKLFVTFREASGQVCWKWRDEQEAHKYKQCANDEQAMVYSLVDDAGGDGVWSQTLQRRLNMNDTVLKNALKQLQIKGLIAPFKNVEHPNKKMYIKASIQPSDRATGGPWYTDQNFDEAFIEDLQKVIYDFIKKQSSYVSRHAAAGHDSSRTKVPKKGVLKGGESARGKKRDASEMADAPTSKAANKKSTASTPARTSATPVLLPLPAGYTKYPTVREIARLLSDSGVTNNTVLSGADVQKLVDVLVWDNLVEPVKVAGKIGYRVSRIAKQSAEGWAGRDDPTGREGGPAAYISAYTETPCGRCPVFDICEDGGPVGPSNCIYFTEWLGID